MAITVETSAHTSWGRWPTQQPSPEYVMAEAPELMEYDSRPTNPAPLQRPPVTPPYIVNNSYSMAPMINLPASHYQTPNPFGFESYSPPSPNPMVTSFRQFQDGLPSLRFSPGESRRPQDHAYSQERPQGCAEEHIHSPPVKPESRIPTPASLATNTPSDSKIIPPNVDDTGKTRIAFDTEVDRLMRAVQLKDNDTDSNGKKPVDNHGENYYPSPPHLDHTTSIEVNIKFNSQDETDADKPHVCKIKRCGRRFTQKTHLDTHRRTHTGERPYQCTIPGCGKWFSQRGNLKIHERRHLGDKPFACNMCDKRFPQKANLRSHEDTHNRIKRFTCRLDTCSKQFGQLGNLKIHMNRFHTAALAVWEKKFNEKPEDEMTPTELEMRKYFSIMFRNSNKGIKGRGVGRHVKTIEEMTSNGNINVPSHPPVQQHAVPIHPPLHHPTVTHGGFPSNFGIPRNDPGHGGMLGRNTHGTYEIYDMAHGSMDGSHPSSNAGGTMFEEDRHRGLGFQDRFHERLY